MTTGARKGLLYLVVLGILFDAGIYWLSARAVNGLAKQQHAQCKFYDDIGGSPITVQGSTVKPSLLGVSIVSDARVAWHQLGCRGTQQPASESFLHWAAYYHLPTG